MKTVMLPLLLLLCVSITKVLAVVYETSLTEEPGFSSRKLLGKKTALKFCNSTDDAITCDGEGEFCKALDEPMCKKTKECREEKICLKHEYQDKDHDNDIIAAVEWLLDALKIRSKDQVKVCIEHDNMERCVYKMACHDYACHKTVPVLHG